VNARLEWPTLTDECTRRHRKGVCYGRLEVSAGRLARSRHAPSFTGRMKSRELAERQLALSRKTIMKLANSLPAEEPLRHIFLSAPKIRKILGEGEAPKSRAKKL